MEPLPGPGQDRCGRERRYRDPVWPGRNVFSELAAFSAAKKVKGVRAIAGDIQIGDSAFHQKTDAEIAAAILDTLRWQSAVNEEKIKVKVEAGIATLQGEVE